MTTLICGCKLGYERCIDCRPGLHIDQEMALAITLGIIQADIARRTVPLDPDMAKVLDEHRRELYAR